MGLLLAIGRGWGFICKAVGTLLPLLKLYFDFGSQCS